MLGLAGAALVLFWSGAAAATYSLTAVDNASGALGGAGASCVPYAVDRIFGAIPGQGALNAQAYFDEDAQAAALEHLRAGLSASQVLEQVTDASQFPLAPRMQWGIVDARGGLARATGAEAQAYAGDVEITADGGRYAATVQGNVLTSARVLEQAAAAFAGGGCDLAERLMLGLEAGGLGGEGDNRCTPEGRPANSAYLNVTLADGSAVHLGVPDVSPADPVAALRAEYERYRAEHPCPSQPEPAAAERHDAGCSLGGRPSRAGLAVLLLALSAAVRRSRGAASRG